MRTLQAYIQQHGAALARDVAGLAGYALIVAGVCAMAGWPLALIVAGAPWAGFYFWGEYRASRGGDA